MKLGSVAFYSLINTCIKKKTEKKVKLKVKREKAQWTPQKYKAS